MNKNVPVQENLGPKTKTGISEKLSCSTMELRLRVSKLSSHEIGVLFDEGDEFLHCRIERVNFPHITLPRPKDTGAHEAR